MDEDDLDMSFDEWIKRSTDRATSIILRVGVILHTITFLVTLTYLLWKAF